MSTAFLSPIQRLPLFILTAANPGFRQNVTGEFIAVIGADESFDVYLDKGGQSFEMGLNDFFKMPVDSHGEQQQFTYVEFRRKAGAAVANNTVIVIIGSGDFRRGSFNVSATVLSVPQGFTGITGTSPNLAVGASTVIFTAAARSLVTIRNNDAAVDIYVSTSAADLAASVTNGKKIGPGEEAEIMIEAGVALRGRHAAAAVVSLNVAAAVF